MSVIITPSSGSSPAGQGDPAEAGQTDQNIEAVLEFYAREEQKIDRPQRILERLSQFIGQPIFIAATLFFVAFWMFSNTVLGLFGRTEFDPLPYPLLQGIVGLGALLTTTVVLIKQNRLAKLAEQRAHLDLKVMLLTEQKAAKLIHLLEELRRDLPNVKNRHDAAAAILQQSMNPDLVLATLDKHNDFEQRPKSAADIKDTGSAG